MQELSDAELMSRLQKGSTEAYTVLYHRYVRDVYRFVYLSIHKKEQAEDIVQETFIRVYKGCHSFDADRAGFRTWLHQIARRLCIDHYRKHSRATFVEWDSHKAAQFETNPVDQSVHDKLLIEQYLEKLPEENRAILILAYYEGRPGNQIADILSLPLGTVKSKLHYSLKKLKQWMQEVPPDEARNAKAMSRTR